jgi:hypothetical protein
MFDHRRFSLWLQKQAIGARSLRAAKSLARLNENVSGNTAAVKELARRIGKAKSDTGYLRQISQRRLPHIDAILPESGKSTYLSTPSSTARSRSLTLKYRYQQYLGSLAKRNPGIFSQQDWDKFNIEDNLPRVQTPEFTQRIARYADRKEKRIWDRVKQDPALMELYRRKKLVDTAKKDMYVGAYVDRSRSNIKPVDLPTGDNMRYKGLLEFPATPQNEPIWYSPRPDVAEGYSRGTGVVAATDENTLRKFGPLGPVTSHISTDNRLLPVKKTGFMARFLSRFKKPKPTSPGFEQVATMPPLQQWADNHTFFAKMPDNKFRQMSGRGLLGKEVSDG